jgi:hypothetical protein
MRKIWNRMEIGCGAEINKIKPVLKPLQVFTCISKISYISTFPKISTVKAMII